MKEDNCTNKNECKSIEKRLEDLCVMTDNLTADDSNMVILGEEWLSLCGELFDDDSGYDTDETGTYFFVPSSMKCNISTTMLSDLLKIADILDDYEETSGYTCEKDYKLSILTHLNKRALENEPTARSILNERIIKRANQSLNF